MTTSRAAVFTGIPGELEICQLPLPGPQGGEILTRVLGCTLCGSDLHSISGRRSVPVPTVLGHEIVGEIIALGGSAPTHDLAGKPLRIGDRVTWTIVASCGDCFFCRRGLPQKCLRGVKYGHEAFRPRLELVGGLAEHCLLAPGTGIVRLPAALPLSVACPVSCATATVTAAMEAAGEVHRRVVCVLGAGLLGLTACAMSCVAGAEQVICVDRDAGRRALSASFGATRIATPEELAAAVNELTEGRGVDLVLEFTGATAAFTGAWPLVRTGGRIVLVGSVFPDVAPPIALEQIVRRQLTLCGIHNYAPPHLLTAVEFLEQCQSRFPFAELVAEWYPLADVRRALDHAHRPEAIRVGIRPDV
uniref:alcohol dehydrogenase n=1 Tax=Schlesneria paludicola TaxID=360056 RepID=A0A7C2P5M5_9PLAN